MSSLAEIKKRLAASAEKDAASASSSSSIAGSKVKGAVALPFMMGGGAPRSATFSGSATRTAAAATPSSSYLRGNNNNNSSEDSCGESPSPSPFVLMPKKVAVSRHDSNSRKSSMFLQARMEDCKTPVNTPETSEDDEPRSNNGNGNFFRSNTIATSKVAAALPPTVPTRSQPVPTLSIPKPPPPVLRPRVPTTTETSNEEREKAPIVTSSLPKPPPPPKPLALCTKPPALLPKFTPAPVADSSSTVAPPPPPARKILIPPTRNSVLFSKQPTPVIIEQREVEQPEEPEQKVEDAFAEIEKIQENGWTLDGESDDEEITSMPVVKATPPPPVRESIAMFDEDTESLDESKDGNETPPEAQSNDDFNFDYDFDLSDLKSPFPRSSVMSQGGSRVSFLFSTERKMIDLSPVDPKEDAVPQQSSTPVVTSALAKSATSIGNYQSSNDDRCSMDVEEISESDGEDGSVDYHSSIASYRDSLTDCFDPVQFSNNATGGLTEPEILDLLEAIRYVLSKTHEISKSHVIESVDSTGKSVIIAYTKEAFTDHVLSTNVSPEVLEKQEIFLISLYFFMSGDDELLDEMEVRFAESINERGQLTVLSERLIKFMHAWITRHCYQLAHDDEAQTFRRRLLGFIATRLIPCFYNNQVSNELVNLVTEILKAAETRFLNNAMTLEANALEFEANRQVLMQQHRVNTLERGVARRESTRALIYAMETNIFAKGVFESDHLLVMCSDPKVQRHLIPYYNGLTISGYTSTLAMAYSGQGSSGSSGGINRRRRRVATRNVPQSATQFNHGYSVSSRFSTLSNASNMSTTSSISTSNNNNSTNNNGGPQQQKKKRAQPAFKKLSFLDLNPAEVARQLTLIEEENFKSLTAIEFMYRCQGDKEKAPALARIVEHFEKISYWVATEICMCYELGARIDMLRRFLHIAKLCWDWNNFSTCMAICAALNMTCVSRLLLTWNGLDPEFKRTWAFLSEMTDHKDYFIKYRKAASEAVGPGIPFSGAHSSLAFMNNERYKDPKRGMFSFKRLSVFAENYRIMARLLYNNTSIGSSNYSNSSSLATANNRFSVMSSTSNGSGNGNGIKYPFIFDYETWHFISREIFTLNPDLLYRASKCSEPSEMQGQLSRHIPISSSLSDNSLGSGSGGGNSSALTITGQAIAKSLLKKALNNNNHHHHQGRSGGVSGGGGKIHSALEAKILKQHKFRQL